MEKDMTALKDLLPVGWSNHAFTEFTPGAMYYPPMDCIIYLREDTSYRADRVDQFMTILWHPHDDRAVGVKIKGGRYLFERVRAILAPLGHKLGDDQFLPLMSALQLAMTVHGGEAVTTKAETIRIKQQKRRTELYRQALEVVGDATIDTRQLALAS